MKRMHNIHELTFLLIRQRVALQLEYHHIPSAAHAIDALPALEHLLGHKNFSLN